MNALKDWKEKKSGDVKSTEPDVHSILKLHRKKEEVSNDTVIRVVPDSRIPAVLEEEDVQLDEEGFCFTEEKLEQLEEYRLKFADIYSDEVIVMAARAAHSAMRCVSEIYGGKKMPDWDHTFTWYRASLTRHIEYVIYHNWTARKCHDCWVRRMLKRGWTLGEKDWEAKTHPYLIKFDELPEVEQVKLRIMRSVAVPFRVTETHPTTGL